MNQKEKTPFLKKPGVQTLIASLICIVIGLFIGFIVLLLIYPPGASEAMLKIVKNFLNYPAAGQMKYLGNTLVKTAPLIMCALSVCFCYKVGLFNIGVAGQYCAGIGVSLYAALAWKMPWIVCLLLALAAGALLGMISGVLKAYCNVNEVISGIMLNWITLYLVNTITTLVKEPTSPYTLNLAKFGSAAILPSVGLEAIFGGNKYVTIAIPLAILIAILIWVILNKTKFGYELRATGYNKFAAKYAGMQEKKNIVITLVIGGALAGTGAAFIYLTGYEQWTTTATSLPGMGFNGIAATFLGGLSPIGTIISSFFIQTIVDGGSMIDKMRYPSQVSDLIVAIIIYFCAFVLFLRTILNRTKTVKKVTKTVQVTKDLAKPDEANKEGGENA